MNYVLLFLVWVHPVALAGDDEPRVTPGEAQFGVTWSLEQTPPDLLHLWIAEDGRLMGLDEAGRVWNRTGRGRWVPIGEGWRKPGADLSDDETVLLDIESRLEELTEEGEAFEFPEEDLEEVTFSVPEVDEGTVVAELEEAGPGQSSSESSPNLAPASLFLVEGHPWVVRAEGVDAWTGLRWDRRFGGQALTGGGASDEQVLIVQGDELWGMAEDGRWTGVQSLGGLDVRSLHPWHGEYLLATREGLWVWSVQEGLRPTSIRRPIKQVVSQGQEALWVRTRESLIRFGPEGEQDTWPLPSFQLEAMTIRQGEPVVAGTGGVWLGEQGIWRAIVGAPTTPVLSIAADDDRVWLLNTEGLQEAELHLTGSSLWAGNDVFLPPLEWLIRAAMHRPEVVVQPGSRSKSVWLPRVELEGNYLPGEGLQYEPESGSTAGTEAAWGVLSRLTWSPPGRRANEVHEEAALEQRASDVLVRSDGSGAILMDPSSLPRAASVVSRTGRSRGSELGQVVVALYRERLGYETLRPPEDLRDEVLSQLDRGAIEALIDVYTEGAYSRWRAGEPQPLGETQ